jgi:hypothetical protein
MTFLLHDEIADVIRSAPVGSVINIQPVRTVKISAPMIDYDGIKATDRCYLDARSATGSLWFVPPEVLTNEIYDAIESGRPVTVNNQNILEM